MTQVAPWFERKFEFTFPAELFPNLYVRLRGTPARREEIVWGIPAQAMARVPEAGKWSAQEHAGHLADVEPLWRSRVEDYVAGRSELTVADLTNKRTFAANHNARALEEILSAFRRERLDLLSRLDQLDPTQFIRRIPHPRLKIPMRMVDHLFFVAEHDDHHLAIIWRMTHNI